MTPRTQDENQGCELDHSQHATADEEASAFSVRHASLQVSRCTALSRKARRTDLFTIIYGQRHDSRAYAQHSQSSPRLGSAHDGYRISFFRQFREKTSELLKT